MNRAVSWFCRIFIKPLVKILLIKEVKGEENIPKTNFILASNHQSHLDWIADGYICVPRRFTFIGQVDKYSGILGLGRDLLYFMAGVIPVNRKEVLSRKRAQEEAIKRVRQGDILIIYPEGTRSRTGKLQKGKWGVAKIFLATGVPILPVGIKGTFELFPPGGKLRIERKIEINIGKPLFFKEKLEEARGLDDHSERYKKICQEITETVMRELSALIST